MKNMESAFLDTYVTEVCVCLFCKSRTYWNSGGFMKWTSQLEAMALQSHA